MLSVNIKPLKANVAFNGFMLSTCCLNLIPGFHMIPIFTFNWGKGAAFKQIADKL